MKFVCDQCNTKYSIADERVRGRILKIRCKTCDHVISVREPNADPDPLELAASHASHASHDESSEHTVVGGFAMGPGGIEALLDQQRKPEPPAPADDWYVSFDGEQEGPYTLERARDRIKSEKHTGKEIHVWRAEFFVWLAAEEVPEFTALFKAAPSPRAPIKTPQAPAATAPTSGVSSTRATGARRATGASAVVASAVNQLELEPAEPRVDTKPVALPPPPEALAATPLLLPLTSAPTVPLADNGHAEGGTAGQMTKPEPRLSRRALAEADEPVAPAKEGSGLKSIKEVKDEKDKKSRLAEEAKKPDEASKAEKKKEKSGPVAKVDPPVDVAAAATSDSAPLALNPPLDTSPIPLPPPPGGEAPIGEPSDLTQLPDPKVRRKNPFNEPGLDLAAPSSVPVVVVKQAPSSSNFLKGLVAVLVVIVIGMGVAFVRVMRAANNPPVPAPVPVTVKDQPSSSSGQRVAEQPIALPDDPVKVVPPATTTGPATLHPDAKKPSAQVAKKGPATKGPAMHASGSTAGNLSSDQKNLAALYNDDGDKSTPHGAPGVDDGRAATQVSQQSIMAVVNATPNKRSLNTCYDRVLKHDATLKRARVVIHVAIGISGSVLRVTIPDPTYADSEIGQCLSQSIKRWHFPAGDAEYETEFPLLLQAE